MRQDLLQKSVIIKTVWSSLAQSSRASPIKHRSVRSSPVNSNQVQFGSVQSGPKGPHFSRFVGSLLKYYLQNIQVYIALKAQKCPKLYFYLLTVKGKRAFPPLSSFYYAKGMLGIFFLIWNYLTKLLRKHFRSFPFLGACPFTTIFKIYFDYFEIVLNSRYIKKIATLRNFIMLYYEKCIKYIKFEKIFH